MDTDVQLDNRKEFETAYLDLKPATAERLRNLERQLEQVEQARAQLLAQYLGSVQTLLEEAGVDLSAVGQSFEVVGHRLKYLVTRDARHGVRTEPTEAAPD